MVKNHQHIIGNILIFLGLLCLALWGYAKYSLEGIVQFPETKIETSLVNHEIDPILINPRKTFSMGVVELTVKDLTSVATFYRDIVGFDTITQSGNTINIGENGQTFLRLIEEKDFTFPSSAEAGLYHIAITHNSRKDLATRLQNILTISPERYQGSSDHGATEAFYFSDPEGNGVELYYDKPRKDWVWKDGKPIMGSTYIDHIGYIKKYADIPVGEGVTTMGHVHLKVGNIDEAKKFYVGTLLLEEMNNRGDALFISRDKYHHHLGMNTWQSLGAGKRTKNTYGLKSFEIRYHEAPLYETIRHNLGRDGYPIEFSPPSSIKVEDPSGNEVVITLEL